MRKNSAENVSLPFQLPYWAFELFMTVVTHDLLVPFRTANKDTWARLLLYSCPFRLTQSEAFSVYNVVAVGVVIIM